MFYVIYNLLPLTLYMWIGYGAMYRRHNSFTKRWPNIGQMKAALSDPVINTIHKGIIRRFIYLTVGWYVALMVALAGMCYLFYGMFAAF